MAKAQKKVKIPAGGIIAVLIVIAITHPSVLNNLGSYSGGATSYTCRHLEHLWTRNGGSISSEFIAAEVGMAESSGDTTSTSPNPDGGTNVGIWQLDTPGGEGAGYSISQLEDPNTNASVTVIRTHDGRNWSKWQTYEQGTYIGQC